MGNNNLNKKDKPDQNKEPAISPRKNWGSEFRKMALNGDDQLLIDDLFDDENSLEWK